MDSRKRQFAIAVIGTMSAGKSTLLNAMMFEDLLPSSNVACTSTVFQITDKDGASKILGNYHQGSFSSYPERIDKSKLKSWNNDGTQKVEILCDLPMIASQHEKWEMTLLDTPGPNYSMDKHHAEVTNDIFSNPDLAIIVCVLNATQPLTDDENNLIKAILKHKEECDDATMVIFVLNQIDQLDLEQEESPKKLVLEYKTHLEKIGFENPLIIPTASRLCLALRLLQRKAEKMSSEEVDQFSQSPSTIHNFKKKKIAFRSLLSNLKQVELKGHIQLFAQFRQFYQSCLKQTKGLEQAWKAIRSIGTPANNKQFLLDDTFFDFHDLSKIELLSGVPLLEKLLEVEMRSHFNKKDVRPLNGTNKNTKDIPLPKKSESRDNNQDNITVSPEEATVPGVPEKTQNSNIQRKSKPQSTNKKESSKMLKVNIKYNPYTVKTDIMLDDKQLSPDDEIMQLCQNRRLQDWIDDLLEKIYESRRDSVIKIYFHGLSLDGEDVKDAAKLFRQKMLMDQSKSVDIHVEVEAAQNDSKRLEKLKKLFEDVKKCPYDDIKNGINMERLEKEFNNAMDSIFEANVIATMSAGKSTFINSMIGQKLLPSANTATTAKIVRIINRDGMNDFRCQRYDKNGKPIGDGNELATKDSMKKWNEDSETSFMDVEGDILTFSEADSMTMAFVDTPGPNNSSNEEHYRTTINAISEKKLSMVIYVLNARQLAINDDARLLNKVREAMEKGGRQAQDRFVFVANQFDSFNPDEEDIRKDGLDKAKKYLEDNGIKNPLVIPISAKLALLLRQKQHVGEENLTGTEKREMAFLSGKFLDMPVFNLVNYSKEVLSERNKKRVDELIEEANRAKDDDRKAEILSGVPVVELLLNDFLQKHAFPAKLKDAVDSFRELTALKPKIKAMQEALEGKQEELKKSTEELKAFTNSNERLEKANAYRKEIEGKKYTISEEAERELVKVATDAEETIRTFDDVISLCTSDRPLENEELFEKAGKIKKISMILFNMLMDKRMIENTIPIETAKKIGAEISQFGMEIAVNVHNTLEKRLQTEYHDALDKMRREYEEYVVKAINKAFPSEKVVIKVLIDATMKMPDVDVIIDQRKEDQGWNVSDAEWYKPWTWLDEHWHKYEVVKLSEVIKELIKNLRVYPQKVNAQFKEKAPENLENAKKAILKHIEEIDAKLIETQLKLEKALEDQSQKQKAFDETNNQVKWLNNFDSELEKILEV